jgi:hypothetical protein
MSRSPISFSRATGTSTLSVAHVISAKRAAPIA